MLKNIIKLEHNQKIAVEDCSLRTGLAHCTVWTLTVRSGKSKYVDLRLYANLGKEIPGITDADEIGSIKEGSRVCFGKSLIKWYSDEFSSNVYVVEAMWFHFNNANYRLESEGNYIDIRLKRDS